MTDFDRLPPTPVLDREPQGDGTLDFLSPAKSPNEMGWLGAYRVLDVIGAGGMGAVFEAEDAQLGRTRITRRSEWRKSPSCRCGRSPSTARGNSTAKPSLR